MRVALAQIDPTVGDIDGNAAKIAEWIGRARERGAELVVFPELCVPGYPAEDLYLKRHFVEANRRAVEELAARRRAGSPPWSASPSRSPAAATSATPTTRSPCSPTAPCAPSTARTACPTTRSSTSSATSSRAAEPATVEVAGDAGRADDLRGRLGRRGRRPRPRPTRGRESDRQPVGLAVPPRQGARARSDVRRAGARLRRPLRLLQPRRRPGRAGLRRPQLRGRPRRARSSPAPLSSRRSCWSATSPPPSPARSPSRSPTSPRSTRRSSSACATTSRKNGFRHVGVALSGGIDSALVALLAVDALGAEHVSCVVMPSPHSSAETQADARTIAAQPRRRADRDPDRAAMAAYESALADAFGGRRRRGGRRALPRDPTRPSEPDLAAENIQARIRGNLMMALSNKHGWLVLTTGNKSEMSVGYATLYGDMAGGFAAIKDVPKTLVYELVRHRNERRRPRAGPGLGARAGALGRAAPRPARQRLAAALRPARPHPRGLRRARRGPRGDDRRRPARRRRRRRGRAWSTAPSTSAARRRRGSASRRRPSAATAASRSPTASAARTRR